MEIAIIASGPNYQECASWSAATYVRYHETARVRVLVPEGEIVGHLLAANSGRFNYQVEHFQMNLVSKKKFTSQLKCHGFLHAIDTMIMRDSIIWLVDADTVCCRKICLDVGIEQAILQGRVGMVVDVKDRHTKSTKKPWYVPKELRLPYVNSGVIATGYLARDMFQRFVALSKEERFLRGPFNDQKVINWGLCQEFNRRLVLLGGKYNGMRRFRSEHSILLHFGGGAGKIEHGQNRRKSQHLANCLRALNLGYKG